MNQPEIIRKCVFVIGPESTGSKLIARICSHVLKITTFDAWGGGGWCDRGEHKVCHRSLPAGDNRQYPDIEAWIAQNNKDYELYFILTTRDITMSELSRFKRFWSWSMAEFQKQSEDAREIMLTVMRSDQRCFIWSYESFMFLRGDYLQSLYAFLGVEADFLPELVDANTNKVVRPRVLMRFLTRRLNYLKQRFRRIAGI